MKNSWEILLRKKEEQRKSHRTLIATENDLEQILSGKPEYSQMSEKSDTVQPSINLPRDTVTNDDSNDLIFLRDLRPPTQVNLGPAPDTSSYRLT